MEFDKQYYENIWPDFGVHRHDFCEGKAQELVSKYGKVKFLDIGTGCGYLVKCLRNLGAEAWGIDVSEYAIKNSCCSEYVLKADVRDIPFKDKFFDVVFSNGMWISIPEWEVPQAVKEVHRVGKTQEHNIDISDNIAIPPEEFKALTWKSWAWWQEQLKPAKILVACPTHEIKEYAMQRWFDNVKKFTYPNIDIFVVDTSPNEEFYNRWKDKMPIVHLKETENEPDMCVRIAKGMEVIRKKFIEGNYYKWLNIEIDVLPESNVIELLLEYGKESDWISHPYPARGGRQEIQVQSGVGCGMFSRKLMSYFDFTTAGYEKCPDSWLWDKIREDNRFTSNELWYYMKNIKHING